MRKSTKSKKESTDGKAQILIQEAVFFEKFSELIGAEVPLLRALEIAATSVRNPTLQTLLLKMIPKLEQGESLTDVFKQYPDYFSSFHLAIIESGEKDGHLEDGFSRVAESMRHDAESVEMNGLSSETKPLSGIAIKPFTSTAEQLSQVSRELSAISSHLAGVSQNLSRLAKRANSSNHKKAKHKR